MKTGRNYKFWFCTGSQDLYGDECLRKVAEHSRIIVEELNKSGMFPYEIIWKPTLITNELIRKTFNEANADEDCAGVITWMHTFSPAKSWILGLKEYRKPLCHLHTQFNQEIPYDTIDMDFMNENQSAHGGREYGHMVTRMGIERKVIVGHWADKKVQERLASWMRTAVGIMESSHIRVCRVADNMRNVAVTEGDKVEAQIKFGWEVDAYPVNEIVEQLVLLWELDTSTFVYGSGKRKSKEQRHYEHLTTFCQKLQQYIQKIEICGPNRNSYSKTDNSATFMRIKTDYMGNDQLLPAYNVQIGVADEYIAVVDVNHYRSDMDCFVPLMEHFKQTYGFYPKYPVADAGYGSYNNYIFCEQNGIEKYMKFPMFKKETKDQKYHEDPFRAVNFRIDEQGVMRCPNDKAFHFLYRKM